VSAADRSSGARTQVVTGGPLALDVEAASDLAKARVRLMTMLRDAGFSTRAQTQVVTAASELLRNALMYAGGGKFEARMTRRGVRIEVWDEGPGISERVMHELQEGTYRSPTGLGKGLAGCKALMDTFRMMSIPGRTHAVMEKNL
jgi:serine/threonine-protein kinase RsbT